MPLTVASQISRPIMREERLANIRPERESWRTWFAGESAAAERRPKARNRALDLLIAGCLLLLLLPLMCLIAIAIKLEAPGPAIFRQRRSGYRGVPFTIYKFRTMRVMENEGEIRQATKGDARVTRLGRILRKTSIDELPQLMNVILGDMSIVGPRPHAIAHDRYYAARIPEYLGRYRAMPGITGWAQVNGSRGETPSLSDMEARVSLDIWYVENQSLRLDLLILFKTIWVELTHTSKAY